MRTVLTVRFGFEGFSKLFVPVCRDPDVEKCSASAFRQVVSDGWEVAVSVMPLAG